jgi:hypothetical protein
LLGKFYFIIFKSFLFKRFAHFPALPAHSTPKEELWGLGEFRGEVDLGGKCAVK